MGERVVSVQLENTVDRDIASEGLRDESTVRRTTVDGVVDTGAVMLVLPEDVVGCLMKKTSTFPLRLPAERGRISGGGGGGGGGLPNS